MKVLFYKILFILGLLFACKSVQAQNFETTCNSYAVDKNFSVSEYVHPLLFIVFDEMAPLYCSPDFRSRVVAHIPFNTKVNSNVFIVRNQLDSTKKYIANKQWYDYTIRNTKWYQIEYNNVVGYIPEWSVCNREQPYDFLVNEYMREEQRLVRLKLPASDKSFVLDEIVMELMHGYRIIPIENCELVNEGQLFAFETYRESCPGATKYSIFHVTDNGFTQLLSSFSTGEAGTFDSEQIYLPFKGKDEVIRLYDFQEVVGVQFDNSKLSKDDIFDLPKNIGIPIAKSIVKTHSYTETIWDKEGNPIELDNGEYKVNVIEDAPEVYKWNNGKLKEMSVLDFINQVNQLSKELKKIKKE